MYRLLNSLCPCLCSQFSDEHSALISDDDDYTPAITIRSHRHSENTHALNYEVAANRQHASNMSSGHSPGHSPSSTLNIHNNLSNEDNEQVQIEKILLNAQENILSAGEYDYGVENITDVDLNTHYHEESIRKHDGKARKNSKESKINKFQILLKECDESVTSNLINATLFKEEEMDELNKIMAELMDVYQEMKVVNFDEELVAFMKF